MNNEQRKELIKIIEQVDVWQRIETSIDGVSLFKAPRQDDKVQMYVEINPVHNGKNIRKKGFNLKTPEEYDALKKLIENEKIRELLEVIGEYYNDNKVIKIEL
ncbi:MAG: hypothetical protein BZ136_06985 [Methanosphaera sp. rholeuAM74]|nr:MAG: hypothetical protein BZ136_06985 [Methanosphaera sp. rholeuAM74]